MIMKIKARSREKKETAYLCNFQAVKMSDQTPKSDEDMIRYLKESIAWLDSFDEESAVIEPFVAPKTIAAPKPVVKKLAVKKTVAKKSAAPKSV